ncbi:hypothetical protein [Candidatus Kuenenia stuttgartiensis]|uniref:hypothetical protein n=1 Tax=Kuenenia stuttgartiensis TaxID=174633 RepID=UPI00146D0DBF|nr:hypothetical protein [Candidatus Kuenenia stuttgartiensis]
MAGATILTDIIVILTFGIVSGFVVKGGGSLVRYVPQLWRSNHFSDNQFDCYRKIW